MKKNKIKKRIRIPPKTRKKLLDKNLGVCCVCKERDIGINFHHLDEDPSNNEEENLAVLCVKEHDMHHRPKAYALKHLELGMSKIRKYKHQWEKTVQEAKSTSPKIIAVLNIYGSRKSIHSVRFLVQDINGKIIYQRLYHLLTGSPDQWTDDIIEEVSWLGKNVKLSMINKPLKVEYCPCCSTSLSNTLDKNAAIHLTAKDWKKESSGSIYINPKFPAVAFILSYRNEILYKAHLHNCNGTHLHFMTDKYEERIPIKKKASTIIQAAEIMQKVISTWDPGKIFIGTQ
ncbi:MAG: hypothetical protein HY841_04060 [Bacteroidetes bacterium]|nr:hypothetical protein [Bacteroidota bacterium]